MTWIPEGGLLTLALAATWFDVRERRIPNALTLPALGAALLIRAAAGAPQLTAGLLGAGICFALSIPLFLAGGLGGGDVKLLTAFGAFLGPRRLASALLVTAFVGGGLALVAIVRRRATARTLWNLYFLLSDPARKTLTGWRREGSEARLTLTTPDAIAVPYGIAIAAGALYGWFLG